MDNENINDETIELVVGQEYYIKFNVPTYEDIQKYNAGIHESDIKNKISTQGNIFIRLNYFVEQYSNTYTFISKYNNNNVDIYIFQSDNKEICLRHYVKHLNNPHNFSICANINSYEENNYFIQKSVNFLYYYSTLIDIMCNIIIPETTSYILK